MSSISLPPSNDNIFKMLIKSNILTTYQRPPPSTSFEGKTAIITGSNTGIGLACAKVMLEHHLPHLIIAVRRIEKGERAADPLRKTYPKAQIDVWQLDMSSYESVQAFAKRCESLPKLDIAILNAGGHPPTKYATSPSGHEMCFQVNYLSTALLSILLLPLLKAKVGKEPGRLNLAGSGTGLVSAFANRNADPLLPSFDDTSKGWNFPAVQERYQVTKTMVMMFVYKLGQAVGAKDVIVNVADPGFTKDTELTRDAPAWVNILASILVARPFTGRTPEQASWNYVDAVSAKGVESHGSFLMDWKIWSFHRMMYTDEGRKTTERLWTETLQELEKFQVRDILGAMGGKA